MKLLTRYRLTFAKVDSEKGEEGGKKGREGRREGGEGRGGEGRDQIGHPVTQCVLSCSV